mgnify:CR=1 FL=1
MRLTDAMDRCALRDASSIARARGERSLTQRDRGSGLPAVTEAPPDTPRDGRCPPSIPPRGDICKVSILCDFHIGYYALSTPSTARPRILPHSPFPSQTRAPILHTYGVHRTPITFKVSDMSADLATQQQRKEYLQNADGSGRNFTTQWWHDSLIDWMMLNPEKRMSDAAKHFSVTETYISLLQKSDNFQRRYAERRALLTGEIQRTTLDRLKGLADASIDCLTERIATERATIAVSDVRETMTDALRALGYGQSNAARQGNAPTQQVAVVISADALASARELMERRKREVQAHDIDAPSAPAA